MLRPMLLVLYLVSGAFSNASENEKSSDESKLQNTGKPHHFIIGNTEQQSNKLFIQLAKNILTKVYNNLGISVEYRGMPSRRALDLANKGQFDADLLRFSNVVNVAEYSNLIAVEPPFVKADVFLVCVKQQDCEQANSLRIGFLEYYLSIQNYCDNNQLQCLPIKIETLGFKELDNNIVNAMLLTIGAIQTLTLMEPDKKLYLRNVKTLNIPVYHYIHLKHAALIPDLSLALDKEMQSSQFNTYAQQVIDKMINKPNIVLMANY